jgi:hypothetical protein
MKSNKISIKRKTRLYYDCRAKQHLPILSSDNQCKVNHPWLEARSKKVGVEATWCGNEWGSGQARVARVKAVL